MQHKFSIKMLSLQIAYLLQFISDPHPLTICIIIFISSLKFYDFHKPRPGSALSGFEWGH